MTTMTPLEVLRAARELISDPGRWTQDEYARDANGRPLEDALDPKACCWCSIGAIRKQLPESKWILKNGHVYNDAINLLHNMINSGKWNADGVPGFNDTHTHPEVLALFDRAIAAEEAKQHTDATPSP